MIFCCGRPLSYSGARAVQQDQGRRSSLRPSPSSSSSLRSSGAMARGSKARQGDFSETPDEMSRLPTVVSPSPSSLLHRLSSNARDSVFRRPSIPPTRSPSQQHILEIPTLLPRRQEALRHLLSLNDGCSLLSTSPSRTADRFRSRQSDRRRRRRPDSSHSRSSPSQIYGLIQIILR